MLTRVDSCTVYFPILRLAVSDTVLGNNVHVDTELATEKFHIQIVLVSQGFADNLMASSSFLDKGTVEGHYIVTSSLNCKSQGVWQHQQWGVLLQ